PGIKDQAGNALGNGTAFVSRLDVGVPILSPIGDRSVAEGTLVSFTASANDANDPVSTLVFSLKSGAPSGAAIDPATGAFTWTPTEAQGPGNDSITVQVSDPAGLSDAKTFTIQVTEVNLAPDLAPIGDKSVVEGSLLTFTAVATDADLPSNVLAFSLDAGAPAGATINATTGVFTWTPPDGPVTATVTVRVTDNGTPALSDFETLNIIVSNAAPVVNAGADKTGAEGQSISFSGVFTDPGTADTHVISWDFGDGTTASALAAAHVYADNGTYAVTLTVTDKDGGAGTGTLEVTVSNVAPTVSAGTDRSAVEGTAVTLTASSFNDKGTKDTHTASISWGDGTTAETVAVTETPFGPPGSVSGATGALSVGSHVYADNGTYIVTLTVSDDDGDVGNATVVVTVTNVAPTVEAGADRVIPEGGTLNLAPATFNDKGTKDTHTATINWGDGTAPETGVVVETPFGPPGSVTGANGTVSGSHTYKDNGAFTVTVSVADNNGESASDTLVVTVTNVAPTVNAGADQLVTKGAPVNFAGTFTDPGADTHAFLWNFGDGATATTLTASHVYATTGVFTATLKVTDDDGGFGTGALTVTVNDAPLWVKSISHTSSGFGVEFNRPIDVASLNLYGTELGGFGPADVSLVGLASGPVSGSLVTDAAAGTITFIRTGGPLPADAYTLTLRSAANGFKDVTGGLLDGNHDGTTGDDYATSFTVTPATAIVLSVPDFARGPGQAVDVPATATGLPIRLSDGTGVASVDFVLKYDPALLTITQVSAGASMPAGTQVVANLGVPGTVTVAIASPTALGAGVRDIVSLTALVPTTAPYRAKEIIDISGVLVNEGAVPAVDDDGLHVVAYFGDTTGNGTYSSLDGQRVLRLAVSLDSGLAPFLLGDPAVIADITGNALVSALDATRIFQEVVGIDRPEIPLLPGVLTLVTGADPFVNIPTTLSGTPGSTVTAPIMIDNAAGLESVDVRLTYNASLLDVLAVRTGSVTAGATLLTNLNVPGVITAALALTTPRTAGAGSLIEIDYRIKSTATPGLTALNLTQVSL
ncbi:MAG: hypothetical protein DMF83_29675, partial [Acidobacteria bacterium]